MLRHASNPGPFGPSTNTTSFKLYYFLCSNLQLDFSIDTVSGYARVDNVWLPCGYHVATVWLPSGYCVATEWLLCGYCD